MPTPLQLAGAREIKETRYATLFTNRLFAGLWLQRSPLRDPSQVVYEKYYGGRPDALIAGVNVEITNKLTLARRPGTTQYSAATFSEAVNSFYSFKQVINNQEQITLMVDSPSAVWTLTPAVKTSLYTKGSASNPFGSWMFAVGNSLYISFNDSTDQPQAWEGGNATIRNWGIATSGSGGSVSGGAGTGAQGSATGGGTSSQGPNGVGTGADGANGNAVWQNPGNITASDGLFSSVTLSSNGGVSNYIRGTNSGFNLPSNATVSGILAEVQCKADAGGVADNSVKIIKGGSVSGTEHAVGSGISTTEVYLSYGNSTDLWGLTWLYSDINASNFGVAFSTVNNNPSFQKHAYVDFIRITVWYTVPGISWATPTNIVGAQGHGAPNYTTVTPQSGINSPQLFATNYGFSLSNAIVGITVAIYGHVSSASGSPTLIVQLRDQNGNAFGTAKQASFKNTSDAALTFGSQNDLWGGTPTTGTVNGSKFGVIIVAMGSSPTFSLNAATITVYTSAGPGLTGNGSGSLTGTWTYAYSYANTNATDAKGNPVVSNIVGGSASVTLSSNLNTAVAVTASSDPQVNAIFLWRTTKGGSTLFYVNSYANATATIYDNLTNATGTAATTDANLDTTKTAATAFQLSPPPQNLYGQTWFAGRLWAFQGNTLFYASGPDLGNIYGNGNEGWPPANFFIFTSQITRLVAVTSGLLVFTVSDIWIIVGNASATGVAQSSPSTTGLIIFNPLPVVADFGLLSPFALDVNGSTLYLMTSDNQGLSIDAGAGISEIGFPIGFPNIAYPNDPSLAAFVPANTYVAWHVAGSGEKAVYFSDGSTGWFRCNPSLPPDGGFVWSPKANIVGGCQAVQSIETAPGVHSLLIGPTSIGGPVLIRNANVFSDNGLAYPANFTMGSINLAEPGQIAEVGFVACDFNRVGASPLVSVLPEEINGTFENISGYVHSDPPALYGASGSPATLYSNRYDLSQSNITPTRLLNPTPMVCRHIQVLTDFGATDVTQNELLSLAIFGTVYQEK